MISSLSQTFKFPPGTVADLPAIPANRHVLRFWQPVWRFNWKNWAKQLKSKFSPSQRNARPPRVPFPWPVCHPLIKCLNLLPIFYSRPTQPTGKAFAPYWEQIIEKGQIAIIQNVEDTLIGPFSPLRLPQPLRRPEAKSKKVSTPEEEKTWFTGKPCDFNHCYYL